MRVVCWAVCVVGQGGMTEDEQDWQAPPGPSSGFAAPPVPMPVYTGMVPPHPMTWPPYSFSPPMWSAPPEGNAPQVRLDAEPPNPSWGHINGHTRAGSPVLSVPRLCR